MYVSATDSEKKRSGFELTRRGSMALYVSNGQREEAKRIRADSSRKHGVICKQRTARRSEADSSWLVAEAWRYM